MSAGIPWFVSRAGGRLHKLCPAADGMAHARRRLAEALARMKLLPTDGRKRVFGSATVIPFGADDLLRKLVTDLVDDLTDLTAQIDRLRRGGV